MGLLYIMGFLTYYVPNIAVKKNQNYHADRWSCSVKFKPLSQFWPSSASWQGQAHQQNQGYSTIVMPFSSLTCLSHALVPTTAETEQPKPLITRKPLWIWFIIYNQWMLVQCRSSVMSQSKLHFGRWSGLKRTYGFPQNWQFEGLSAETSFSHTGIPLKEGCQGS